MTKKNKMKYLIMKVIPIKTKVLIIFFTLTMASCNTNNKPNFSGQWFVQHAFINKKDILNNPVKPDLFDVPVSKARILNIGDDGKIFFFKERFSPVEARILSYDENKSLLNIKSNYSEVLNDNFIVKIDTLKIIMSGIESYQINMMLKSSKCSIYMKKFEKRGNTNIDY